MTATRIALMGIVLALSSCSDAATTITVNPGGNIQSAIHEASPGDTVLVKAGEYKGGLTLNKSVTVVGEGQVTVRPAAAGTGTAVSVQCSACGVDNIDFIDFRYGFGTLDITGRNDVFLTNSAIVNANYHVWIIATAKGEPSPEGRPLVGKGYLVVTVPTYSLGGRTFVRDLDRWIEESAR